MHFDHQNEHQNEMIRFMERLKTQAVGHNSEFHYLIGINEMNGLSAELRRKVSELKEPIGTVINKNFFVYSNIPLKLAELPFNQNKIRQNLNSGQSVSVDSLGVINAKAKQRLAVDNPNRVDKPGTVHQSGQTRTSYFYTSLTSAQEYHYKCEELDKVLAIMGVSLEI